MISNIPCRILTEEKIEQVMDMAYRVMEEVGMDVCSDEAIAIFKEAGCGVDGIRVTIPRALTRKCIETAPAQIQIYDRFGNEAMLLGGYNSYFGSGPTCCNFMDPYTGERRPATKEDAANTAKVIDALPNMSYAMSLTMIGDHTAELADVHEVDAMLRNTAKPIATWAFNARNMETIFKMCGAVAGSDAALREKPFLIVYNEPTSPLTHTKEAMEKLMLAARYHVPAMYTPGMIMGGTSPVTIAGSLAVGLADSLTGCVLSQLVKEGAPFIGGTSGTPMDMKTMTTPYGAPETSLLLAASNEIMHDLGLPSFDMAGATDSKVVDAQAGIEVAQAAMISVLTGGNLIHDCGFMDIGLMGSLSHLVVCDEIAGMTKRYCCDSVNVSEAAMDFETIKKAGPGGSFLSTRQTLKGFKKEFYMPTLMERRNYEAWDTDGRKTMAQRAEEKARRILAEHQVPPLTEEILAQLDALVSEAESRERQA